MSKDTTQITPQILTSRNTKLVIKSFKSQKHWEDMRNRHGLKNVWDVVEWMIPVGLLNIHNYDLISGNFTEFPTIGRVFDFLRSSKEFHVVFNIDMHNPFLGCHLTIGLDDEEAETPKQPDCFITGNTSGRYLIRSNTSSHVKEKTSILNQFTFHEIFNKYINSGNGKYHFGIESIRHGSVFDKRLIGRSKEIVFRGASFENSIPIKDASRSIYHNLVNVTHELKEDKTFHKAFMFFTGLLSRYISSANMNKVRIGFATRYIPIPYTDADHLMRDLRYKVTRIGLLGTDFDKTFVPYLEVGKEDPYKFVFGVVTR